MKPGQLHAQQTFAIAKKCEEEKTTGPALRDDKLKKIHKGAHHRKPAKAPTPQRQPTARNEEEQEQENPFCVLFDRVYEEERSTLNTLMLDMRGFAEMVSPTDLTTALMRSMTKACRRYQSDLLMCCFSVVDSSFKADRNNEGEMLADLTKYRENVLGLMHKIYEKFETVLHRNELVDRVLTAIAERNPAVRKWLESAELPMTLEDINYRFFEQLLHHVEMLRCFCGFAQRLLTEDLIELTAKQRAQLELIVQLSTEKQPPRRRKKKKRDPEPLLSEEQLEAQQNAQLIGELERMTLPSYRLMVEFSDDFLLGMRRQLEDGHC